MASKAKKAGNTEGIRTGGHVCSIIGLAGSGIAFVIAGVVVGMVGGLISIGKYLKKSEYMYMYKSSNGMGGVSRGYFLFLLKGMNLATL